MTRPAAGLVFSVFTLVFALVLTGCDEPTGSTWPGPSVATLENGGLVEEVRLGGLDGPEETTYGSVTVIAPIREGGFFVVDGQVPIIRRYSADGEFMGNLGRRGQGPGEYTYIVALSSLNDGRTGVVDASNARVTHFDGEGEVAHTFPIQPRAFGQDNRFDPATGHLYTIVGPEEGGFVEGPNQSIGDWARVDPEGTIERLREAPPENRVGPRFVLSGAQGSYPFSTMTQSVMGAGGDYWENRNDTDSILHVRPDGIESWIHLEGERVSLTQDELEQWRFRGEQMYEQMQSVPRPGGGAGPSRSDYVDIPLVKPYVREMFADAQGRLWVLRYADPIYMPYSEEEAAERAANGWAPHNWRDQLLWELYDTDDELLGRLILPPKSGLYDALGDDIYVLSLGDYRESYVSRYRVDFAAVGGG